MLKNPYGTRQNYFNLTKEMTLTDFKLRYHGSFLGIFWALLKPLLTFGVLYAVFYIFLRFPVKNYPLYLFLGIILWNFFAEATTISINSLSSKAPLIKKINFPRNIVIFSSTLTSFLNFILNLVIFYFFLAFSNFNLSWSAPLALLFFAELFFISLGMGLLVSALYSKFKDLRYIWEVLLQIGFWATPIIYSIEMVPQKFHFLVYLNPMTRIIQYSREAILEGLISNLDGMIALFLATIIIFAAGYFVFEKRSPYFSEEL